jgi:hypothetical protein
MIEKIAIQAMISCWKRLGIVLMCAVAVAACDAFSSEPVYSGISVAGFNYTPYNLTRFVVRDKFGNRAGGGGDLPPSAGAGSLSCCYKLKGTEFQVEWEVYDADENPDPYAPLRMIEKRQEIHVPKMKATGEAGEDILGLHFYPDDHVEMELRHDLSGTRIDYTEVHHWFETKYGKAANPDDLSDGAAYRRTARVAAQGWMKYRFTDPVDLEQFVYYTLLVNPHFDESPAVQEIVKQADGKPGAFGAAMLALPDSVVRDIKRYRPESTQAGTSRG